MIADLSFVQEFHRAVGQAITRWQYVETGLYIISHCMLGTDHRRASTVFFHIDSAKSKLALTDKLCRVGLTQNTYQRHWLPLKKSVGGAVTMRNALAHFDVTFIDPDVLTAEASSPTAFPIALVANSHDPNSQGGPQKGLYLEQIRELSHEFHGLASDLLGFVAAHIPDWPERAKSLPQETLHLLSSLRNGETPKSE